MKVENHKAKALRIERSLAKCRANDFEIRIEGAMLAATHWVNLAFHAMRVTGESQDVMHSYQLTVNEFRRLSIADKRLVSLLSEIEDIRPLYVRGDVAGGSAQADRALHLLSQLRSIALAAPANRPSG